MGLAFATINGSQCLVYNWNSQTWLMEVSSAFEVKDGVSVTYLGKQYSVMSHFMLNGRQMVALDHPKIATMVS